MPWWIEPKRDGQRPIEEPKTAMCRPLKARCTVPTVERSGKSCIDCVLPASERVCADLRVQRRLDQVQELLLCGLLEGPHIWAPLARYAKFASLRMQSTLRWILLSWSQGTRSLISVMSAGHLEATAQGFDILRQAVTTRLDLLERNHFQHFL